MDKSWMHKSRLSNEYAKGVESFLDFAFDKSSEDNMIVCPCVKCANVHWHTREVVEEHLMCDWNPTVVTLVGSSMGSLFLLQHLISDNIITMPPSTTQPTSTFHSSHGAMGELLRDAFNIRHDVHGGIEPNIGDVVNDEAEVQDGAGEEEPPTEAAKFYKLLEDMNEKLYDGSKHSRLYFCIRLFHLKCMCGMTGKALDYLIEFLKEFFPAAAIPTNSRESKKVIKDLGLGYEKIHACPNDCMLYWSDKENQQACLVCGTSRWLSTDSNHSSNDDDEMVHKRPAKVLRYFPIIPRLQRIFMSSRTSGDMTWHVDGRTEDGCLRHPADAEAWKTFDTRYPDFASDPRNIRLGLSSDGFNPFKLLSTSYSTWPVVLIPYNLPPWKGMKQSSFLLSMIIPGVNGPGNDIDIYLQPLIKESSNYGLVFGHMMHQGKRNFNLRAALMWTINDFPAYAILSGWSTKGNYGKRIKQRLRKSKASSSSKKRQRQESNFQEDSVMDKEEDESQEADLWKKRSIFFDLPYWEHLLLRHNLDVMHIEKNVCENIIGTLLNVDGKSKDNLKARLDLVDMGIRHVLHPEYLPNGRTRLPPAVYSMTKGEKDVFCQVLKNIKVPDGYSSNISRCVNQKERKLHSLKSHDHHILLHDLLPIALRLSSSKQVLVEVKELCAEQEISSRFYCRSEYKNILRQQMRARRSTARDVDMQFTRTFHEWLAEVVSRGRNVTEEVRFLAQGPNRIVKRYKGYIINGFRFHTKSRERLRRTQNSGCVVTSSTVSYASASDANPRARKMLTITGF
ncbi:uncharacterized protein LOC120270384 [Dioscorea cayenensis subsp. rotundata]|uniref:Uncharacterized protein LOC120270384 n=1 Tax=Dioscorea cayennensis subsp. rotundata TaxID=55577 RepID=A0AB40C0M4_DIOCR|nr:uncharacterized protein LOC120270384 [Dioscorea cayenensis subsp. rotundata]